MELESWLSLHSSADPGWEPGRRTPLVLQCSFWMIRVGRFGFVVCFHHESVHISMLLSLLSLCVCESTCVYICACMCLHECLLIYACKYCQGVGAYSCMCTHAPVLVSMSVYLWVLLWHLCEGKQHMLTSLQLIQLLVFSPRFRFSSPQVCYLRHDLSGLTQPS